MGKRKKDSMKRAARRERAKLKADGTIQDEVIAQEQEADEQVEKAAKAEVAPAAPAREKKAPKPVKEEESDNAWQRLKAFLLEVRIEARKINWPAIDDTWKSTWVTIIVIIALSIFMGVASIGFQKVSQALFSVNERQYTAPATPAAPAGGGSDTTTPAPAPADTGGGAPVSDPSIPANPLDGE